MDRSESHGVYYWIYAGIPVPPLDSTPSAVFNGMNDHRALSNLHVSHEQALASRPPSCLSHWEILVHCFHGFSQSWLIDLSRHRRTFARYHIVACQPATHQPAGIIASSAHLIQSTTYTGQYTSAYCWDYRFLSRSTSFSAIWEPGQRLQLVLSSDLLMLTWSKVDQSQTTLKS